MKQLLTLALAAAALAAVATTSFVQPANAATALRPSIVAMGKRAPTSTDSSQNNLPPDEQLSKDLQNSRVYTTPADVFIPGSTEPVRRDDSSTDGN